MEMSVRRFSLLFVFWENRHELAGAGRENESQNFSPLPCAIIVER